MATPVSRQARSAVVLMVDDNEDHVFLARESLEEARVMVNLQHVDGGEKCLAYLRREPPYESAPWPDVVLLDIHMPRMDGYQVMEEISKDPVLRNLTVIVLSTSAELVDVKRMYALGCKSYLTKPVDFQGFTAAMRTMAGYWFDLVVLPGEPEQPA